ncbi:MAG: MBG domain-containing protein [Limisphaerales bacterium]
MAIARRPITVKAADSVTTFGSSASLGLEYLNLAPGETSANLKNAGFAFLSGQPNIATLAPQVYTVFANGAFGDNYVVTHANGTLTVGKAPATINVADTSATYDGTAKTVSVTTEPAGLATSVTYNGAAAAPVNAGTYAVQVDVSNANYAGTFVTSLVIAPGSATVSLGDLAQNFDGTGKAVSATTDPAGIAVAVTYNGNPVAPTQAGSYAVEASISDPNFSGSTTGTLEIGKGVAQIALSNLSQVADGSAKAVGVSTSPAGLANVVTYDGAATAPTAVGSYAVSVTVQSSDYSGSAEGTLTILEGATITFDGLLASYTGDPISPTITTTPAGLKVNVTYNKSPVVPHEAGTYEVVASIEDATYSGTAKSVFEITKSSTATINFVASSLQSPWNNVKAPQATTDPAGLDVRMTYNGSLALPSTPGEYEVKAIINDRNVKGSKSATFTIGKAPQDISFPAIPNLSISGNPVILVLSATSNSGLPVKYIVLRGGATVDGNLLTISQPGLVSLTAQQLGNENYLPADEEVRSFEVTGTGVPLGAAQTEASLNDDGSVSLGVSGSPFESLSIYSASVVDAEFKPIVKIVLDADGKGSYNTASDADQRFFQVK